MKKAVVFFVIVWIATVISCSKKMTPTSTATTDSTTTAITTEPGKPSVSYAVNVKTLIETRCTPCHIPARNGFKEPLDTYDAVKKNIDAILVRIKKDPSERGFMPFKNSPLTLEQIAVFENWKDGGMKE